MKFLALKSSLACLMVLALFGSARNARAAVNIGAWLASEGSAGVYDGLVGSTNSTFTQAGSISFDLSRTGAFSGKLVLGDHVSRFESALQSGSAVIILHDGTSPLTVDVTLNPAVPSMSGSIAETGGTAPFIAGRVTYGRTNPAPEAGRYTLLLSDTASAEGYGCATMRVDRTGRITVTGLTGAGAPFTASSYLDGGAVFPLYAVTKGAPKGSLHGWIQFESVPGVSDFDGIAGWSAASSGTVSQTAVIGSTYVPPRKNALFLPFAAGAANADLDFGQDTTAFASIPVTVSAAGVSSTTATVSKLMFDRQIGGYVGYFSLSGTAGPFFGVAFQAQGLGAGLLLTNGGADWATLQSSGSNTPVQLSGSSPAGGNDDEGAGATVSIGAGSTILTGSSTYTGSTTTGGTITLSNGGDGGGLTLGTSDGGTLSFGNPVISGSISPILTSGTLNAGGGATLSTGAGLLSSGISLTSGTLVLNPSEMPSGTVLSLNAGTILTTGSSTIILPGTGTINLSGTTAVLTTGSGTIVLSSTSPIDIVAPPPGGSSTQPSE
jgi:hypothetical protein